MKKNVKKLFNCAGYGINENWNEQAKTNPGENSKIHSFDKQTILIAMLHGQMQPMWQKRPKNRIINRTNRALVQMHQF